MSNLFDIERFYKVIFQILPYWTISAQIVVVAVGAGSLLGIIVAVLRINKIPVVNQILDVYLSFMRGTPMAIQLMLIYYALPVLLKGSTGIDINGWEKLTFVEITFVINEGAFLGEIFRSAILSVPYLQTEAGYSVGLNGFQTFTRIVLPQAARTALPAYGSDIIGVFHNTSIAYMLGVVDVIGRARSIRSATGHGLEAYLFIAIVYIVVSILLRLLFEKLDRKLVYGQKLSTQA